VRCPARAGRRARRGGTHRRPARQAAPQLRRDHGAHAAAPGRPLVADPGRGPRP